MKLSKVSRIKDLPMITADSRICKQMALDPKYTIERATVGPVRSSSKAYRYGSSSYEQGNILCGIKHWMHDMEDRIDD